MIEVGCVPGSLLVYFHKEFGYRPSGIDYLPRLDVVRATLEANCIPCDSLVQADFFEWSPEARYDVVFSNGFIEHFRDYGDVIRRHATLVRPGGYLVLVVPNYTHLQYLMRSAFDGPNLAKHLFDVMDPRILQRSVERCGMEVDYCGYAVTFDFWVVRRGTGLRRWLTWFVEGAAGRLEKLLAGLRLGHIPNRWLSPFVVCVARRRED